MSSTARRLHSSLETVRRPTAWETRCSTKAKLGKRCSNCSVRIVYGLICPRRSILSARRILQSVRPKPLRRRGQESLLSNGKVLSQRKHILVWRDSTGSQGMLTKPPPKCKNSTNCRSVVAVLRRTDPPQTFLPKRRCLLREELDLPHRRIRGTEDARGTVFPNPRVYHPLGFSSEVAAFRPALLSR